MPPTPQSNVERYLSVIAGHGGEIPSEPSSRVEYYLDEIVKNGGIGGKLKPKVVASLPATGESGVLYLVSADGSGKNLYDEYIWIEEETRFELLGQTKIDIDLSEYVKNARKIGNVPLSADIPVTLTGDTVITVTNTGTASAIGYSVTHGDSGVTAGSKGDITNQTPGFGGTFKVLSATADAKGHVTALGDHTARIPDAEATVSAKGLMSATDKAKLDKHVPKGSAVRGIYIDASNSTQAMAYEVNADVPSGFAPASAMPLMDGTAAVGTSAKYAREDHKHPTDTSRASAADLAALADYIKSMDVYRNASGNPATFSDADAANVRALSVTITPAQSGSGDPSPTNIRPISGVSSVTVTRTGEKGTNPQTATVSFVDSNSDPLTVYGGKLNVTTGELTVAKRKVTFNGSESWSIMTNQNGYVSFSTKITDIVYIIADGSGVGDILCSHYALTTATAQGRHYVDRGIAQTGQDIRISDIDFADKTVDEFKAWLAEHPVEVLYPLETPVTYQLTPQQLATLSGYNAVSTDAASVSVTYKADTSLVWGGAV